MLRFAAIAVLVVTVGAVLSAEPLRSVFAASRVVRPAPADSGALSAPDGGPVYSIPQLDPSYGAAEGDEIPPGCFAVPCR